MRVPASPANGRNPRQRILLHNNSDKGAVCARCTVAPLLNTNGVLCVRYTVVNTRGGGGGRPGWPLHSEPRGRRRAKAVHNGVNGRDRFLRPTRGSLLRLVSPGPHSRSTQPVLPGELATSASRRDSPFVFRTCSSSSCRSSCLLRPLTD